MVFKVSAEQIMHTNQTLIQLEKSFKSTLAELVRQQFIYFDLFEIIDKTDGEILAMMNNEPFPNNYENKNIDKVHRPDPTFPYRLITPYLITLENP